MGKWADNKARSSERELQELLSYQSKLARRKKELPAHARVKLDELRKMLTAKAAGVVSTIATENMERPEQQKIDAALREGERRGWVDIHDVGDPAAEKHCIIMGSAHYSHTAEDITKIPECAKRAQFQLFGQLHLLQEHGVQSLLLVEGHSKGEIVDPHITINFPDGRSIPVRSEETQQHFLQHPEHFMQLQHDMHVHGRHSAFYELSSYPNINGMHSPEVDATLTRVYDMQLNEKRFVDRYKPKNGGNHQVSSQLHNGRWWIYINQQWVQPEVLLQDCNDCLQFLDELDAFNVVREDEAVEHFANADPAHMPMIWVGLGHVKPITEKCLALGMSVRQVIPVANRQLSVPPDSRREATQIRAFAEKYVQKNQALA